MTVGPLYLAASSGAHGAHPKMQQQSGKPWHYGRRREPLALPLRRRRRAPFLPPRPTHPGDGLAPPRSHYNHRAALVAWVVLRLRGGARAGSAGERGREIAFRSDLEDLVSFCGASTFEPCVWRSRSRSVLPSSGVTRWRHARPKGSARCTPQGLAGAPLRRRMASAEVEAEARAGLQRALVASAARASGCSETNIAKVTASRPIWRPIWRKLDPLPPFGFRIW